MRRTECGTGVFHQALHVPNGLIKAGKEGSGDDRVADVQLMDLRDPRNRNHVVVVETVPRIDNQAQRISVLGGCPNAIQFRITIAPFWKIRIMPGVKLNDRGTGLDRSLDLPGIGINKERHLNPGSRESSSRLSHPIQVAQNVKTPLRSQFLPLFRHQTAGRGSCRFSDSNHLVGHRHFKVESGFQQFAQKRNVPILDMASVFPKMGCDAAGTRLLSHQGGVDDLRIQGASRLPDGGNVIDIDPQVNGRERDRHQEFLLENV